MKFHIRHEPHRQRVNVYLELNPDPDHDGERVFMTRGNGIYGTDRGQSDSPVIHRVPMGAEPPIWDWFPEDAIEPLVKALSPKPEVSERHLDDAINVRDRLLRIHEAMIMGQLSPADADHMRDPS